MHKWYRYNLAYTRLRALANVAFDAKDWARFRLIDNKLLALRLTMYELSRDLDRSRLV